MHRLLLAVLALSLAACGPEDVTPTPQPRPDAGTPLPDAGDSGDDAGEDAGEEEEETEPQRFGPYSLVVENSTSETITISGIVRRDETTYEWDYAAQDIELQPGGTLSYEDVMPGTICQAEVGGEHLRKIRIKLGVTHYSGDQWPVSSTIPASGAVYITAPNNYYEMPCPRYSLAVSFGRRDGSPHVTFVAD